MLRTGELCPSPLRSREPRGPHRSVSLLSWLLVLLLVPVTAGSQTVDWVEIVQQDDRGIELVLRAPEAQVQDGDVQVPGFQIRAEAGLPRTWSRTAWIAVPGARGASLQIVDENPRPLTGVRPQVQWDPARTQPESDIDAAARPGDAWKAAGRWPATSVQISAPTQQRGVHMVALDFTPLQLQADGAAQYTREVRVRLQFRDRVTMAPQPREDRQLRSLVNHRTAARWQRQAAVADVTSIAAPGQTPDVRRAPPLPPQRVRLTIRDTGIYQVSQAALETAGVPASVDPRTLRLYMDEWHWIPLYADSFSSWSPSWEMREVDIWVKGEGDGSFDTDDAVVFYAVGPAEYLDLVDGRADSLAHASHPYDSERYAWLVWGGDMGSRMQTVSASAPAPVSDPIITEVWHREHFEVDQLFGHVDDLWYWQAVTAARPALATFALDLAGASSTTGAVHVQVGADAFYFRHAFDTTINTTTYPTTTWDQPGDLPRNHIVTYDNAPLNSNNDLRIVRNTATPGATGQTLFLKFDVTYQRRLAASQAALRWSHRQAAASEVFELAGFGTQTAPDVFDVSDPWRPVRLIDPTLAGATWHVRASRLGRAHYEATTLPQSLSGADVEGRLVTDLRARTQAPHMMFITHNSLRAEADRLLAHRRSNFVGDLMGDPQPDIDIVNVRDIYENFSGGRQDPLAIRNYLKYLVDKTAQPRLQFLLLFGEATHDPRRNVLASTPTLVPTPQAWYADDRIRRWYAVDDWLAEMGRPAEGDNLLRVYPLPDFAVGRVTPRGLSDARAIVDKIIAFENSAPPGAWRTTVLLTADDEHHRGRAVETYHTNNIERLPPMVPDEWDVEKFYLTEYPLRLGQKPEARAAFIRRWSEGLGVLIYQGHGAPRQLADEVLFLGTDIPALVNGQRLPVFMAFSCTVAEFDDPELQSMSEELLASQAGGAIVAMGATTPTFAGPNALLNEEVFEAIWENGPTSNVPLGTALMLGKQRSMSGTGKDNERYAYIGDPAMTLLNPNTVSHFVTGADTLGAGSSTTINGRIEAADGTPQTGFQGQAEVAIFGSADESGYQSIYPPNIRLNYDLRGAPLYRGEVPVVDGEFSFDFFVPANAVLGNKGRISFSAWETPITASSSNSLGGRSDLVLEVAQVVETDTVGPVIALRFPSDLTHVKPGTELVAELQDPQGINIQGLNLLSSILLDFDDSNQPLDITSFFRYKAGSSTFGSVTVSVPDDLQPGAHTATLLASDNLQNTSSKTISFQVVEEQVTQLVNVVAFPNPFRDRTHFIFEITDGARVEIEVFTSSGRRVWRYERDYADAGQVQVEWGGVDHVGDSIANGTYLYRVRAHPYQRGASSLDHIGKVVIVREG